MNAPSNGMTHGNNPPQPSGTPPRRVLLADDDDGIRGFISALLTNEGFAVTAVSDGEQAWDALVHGRYDLLVSDNDMPRLTGLALVQRIRDAGIDLPVIFASGSMSVEGARRHSQLQGAAILPKPFTTAQFFSAVYRILPSPSTEASRTDETARISFSPPSKPNMFARLMARVSEQLSHSVTPELASQAVKRWELGRTSKKDVVPREGWTPAKPLEAPVKPRPEPQVILSPAAAKTAPSQILVVDDDSMVRESLAAVLESEGYVVREAQNGMEAVVSAINHTPDLVLLDLNMPQWDGWTAFSQLDRVKPLMPVIVMTARPNQYEKAVRLGVDAFMEKPLNFPLLVKAIKQLTDDEEPRHIRRIADPAFVTRLLVGSES